MERFLADYVTPEANYEKNILMDSFTFIHSRKSDGSICPPPWLVGLKVRIHPSQRLSYKQALNAHCNFNLYCLPLVFLCPGRRILNFSL